jgi:hypothetical protein
MIKLESDISVSIATVIDDSRYLPIQLIKRSNTTYYYYSDSQRICRRDYLEDGKSKKEVKAGIKKKIKCFWGSID